MDHVTSGLGLHLFGRGYQALGLNRKREVINNVFVAFHFVLV